MNFKTRFPSPFVKSCAVYNCCDCEVPHVLIFHTNTYKLCYVGLSVNNHIPGLFDRPPVKTAKHNENAHTHTHAHHILSAVCCWRHEKLVHLSVQESLRLVRKGEFGAILSYTSEQSDPMEARWYWRRLLAAPILCSPPVLPPPAAARRVTSKKCARRFSWWLTRLLSEPDDARTGLKPPGLAAEAPGIQAGEAFSRLVTLAPKLFSQKLANLFLLLLNNSIFVLGEGVGDRLATLSSNKGQPLSELLVLEWR